MKPTPMPNAAALSIRFVVAAILLGTASSCVSPEAQRRTAPRFDTALPVPLVIQILDERPEAETAGAGADPNWIYLDEDPALQLFHFADGVGYSMVRFRAIPDYALAPSDADPADYPYFMRVHLRSWTARWPTRLPRTAETAPVEGRCSVVIHLFRNGRKVHTFRHTETPPVFSGPLQMIHAGNVERIVRDSLAHQARQVQNGTLEAMLHDLSRVWPSYVTPR